MTSWELARRMKNYYSSYFWNTTLLRLAPKVILRSETTKNPSLGGVCGFFAYAQNDIKIELLEQSIYYYENKIRF